MGNFNSRPCVRGNALTAAVGSDAKLNFNSRPCVRGNIPTEDEDEDEDAFQFTPLREGQHELTPVDMPVPFISIHAPA